MDRMCTGLATDDTGLVAAADSADRMELKVRPAKLIMEVF
jgi:hypothetical protein